MDKSTLDDTDTVGRTATIIVGVKLLSILFSGEWLKDKGVVVSDIT